MWTFLPQEEKVKENEEWRGILLYASGQEDSLNIIPIVRYGDDSTTNVWMEVENLPQLYGNRMGSCPIPPSQRRIYFEGGVRVKWREHTLPLLWALDRHLAGLPPLMPALN
ncbi:unnamed protein product [Darwinula stevensoni]|uniref:Uncharacterized protein n=1 Tax=Darwinula stevensoni TaxID=69355 RepID=A0A7R8XE01_9CRUS|nr:unnamed protein product [Darwinula stevensoni]CAG0893786.1 unnamed protein product [Darwinula stevensoni]